MVFLDSKAKYYWGEGITTLLHMYPLPVSARETWLQQPCSAEKRWVNPNWTNTTSSKSLFCFNSGWIHCPTGVHFHLHPLSSSTQTCEQGETLKGAKQDAGAGHTHVLTHPRPARHQLMTLTPWNATFCCLCSRCSRLETGTAFLHGNPKFFCFVPCFSCSFCRQD